MSTSSVSISSATNLNAAGDRFGKPARTRWYSQPTALRLVFWILGLSLACAQAWVYRYQTSADSISYLDMSDGIMPGGDWHRIVGRNRAVLERDLRIRRIHQLRSCRLLRHAPKRPQWPPQLMAYTSPTGVLPP